MAKTPDNQIIQLLAEYADQFASRMVQDRTVDPQKYRKTQIAITKLTEIPCVVEHTITGPYTLNAEPGVDPDTLPTMGTPAWFAQAAIRAGVTNEQMIELNPRPELKKGWDYYANQT